MAITVNNTSQLSGIVASYIAFSSRSKCTTVGTLVTEIHASYFCSTCLNRQSEASDIFCVRAIIVTAVLSLFLASAQ